MAGSIGLASPAEASRYWSDYYEPGYSRGRPAPQPPKQRVRNRQAKKVEAPKDSVKPQGPVIIAISIERQTMKVYDANGFFAETPISTGTKGHPTPMGVFSVIQKRKLHHSNIYSGAPMPFMQRITWSGIAMHAGALPGYPASHGCIRMPMAFAARIFNWTRIGARVVITPGEITPAKFAHPLLAEQKVAPQPQPTVTLEPDPDAPPAPKGDKAGKADAGPAVKSATAEARLDLRSSVGHDGATSLSRRNQTRTADASGATGAVTMSDASSSAAGKPSSDAPEGKSPEAATADIKPSDPETADRTEPKPDQPAAAAEAPAAESAKPDEASLAAKAGDIETETPTAANSPNTPEKTEDKTADKASDKSGDSATAAVDARPAAPDAEKDQTRPPDAEKAAAAKPEPPKPAGRIAVLVSGKDGRLYVREDFKPLFDVPVSIAPSERLLGTHVFTAEVDKNDSNALRWSVVSLPVAARNAQKNEDDQRPSRRRKVAGVVPAEVKQPIPAPNSPAEALDRITIPPEAMARIAEALGTGGSIVVSDHGVNRGGETGEGTDFIVPLR
ncbi:L,D-transpeptidase [Bradyrhizobium sp.]|uniref:L,D-transpeptidase n=1 Tax=Bradyrhizobium sp. TaxID=376 RepID=UPI002733BDDD|nr:L,D-transpeptidase family protein [Bradyrhizobium sp.]MDP3690358.1 L,D-transpeptidase family protein [Bradyrhizobium sp.]